ncbi:MAG: exo-alpha-sialidase [Cyclobacteriaceae bacterium]
MRILALNSRLKPTAAILLSVGIVIGCSAPQKEAVETDPLEVLQPPIGANSSLPFLTKAKDRLYLSWVEKSGDSTMLKYAFLEKDKWSEAKKIASGTDWFVNWADYPMISVTDSGMMAHFLAKSSEGAYSYDVNLTQSENGDAWSEPFVVHDDGTETEHGFVTMLPFEGKILTTWLDGRNTGDGGHGDVEMEHRGAMTVRSAIVDLSGNLEMESQLDDRVCDCCQTGGAVTATGPVIVYRDRSEEEIRDMSIVRLVNGSWTAPQPVFQDNWKIAGCPVNGPRAAAIENSLAVAWFSAAEGNAEVKLIFSKDGGETFGPSFKIDGGKPAGRVDVAMVDENNALVSWVETTENGAEVRVSKISSDGNILSTKTIGEIDPSRKSGFPQLEIIGEGIYVAWTDLIGKEQPEVRIVKV